MPNLVTRKRSGAHLAQNKLSGFFIHWRESRLFIPKIELKPHIFDRRNLDIQGGKCNVRDTEYFIVIVYSTSHNSWARSCGIIPGFK